MRGVVIDQELLIRIGGCNFLEIFGHLIRADDDQIIFAGLRNFVQRFQPLRLIRVRAAHLDGLIGDAPGILKGFQAGLCGIEEGFVAEVAVDEADDVVYRFVARACGCFRSGALAGKHRKRHQQGQQDRYQFLHF